MLLFNSVWSRYSFFYVWPSFFLFFLLFSALFHSLDEVPIFHYSIFPLPPLAQTLSRIVFHLSSSAFLSLSLSFSSFLQHPFRNLLRCTFHFTFVFSFPSFLFRPLTSHLPSIFIAAPGPWNARKRNAAVWRLEQLAEKVIYQAVALGSPKRCWK